MLIINYLYYCVCIIYHLQRALTPVAAQPVQKAAMCDAGALRPSEGLARAGRAAGWGVSCQLRPGLLGGEFLGIAPSFVHPPRDEQWGSCPCLPGAPAAGRPRQQRRRLRPCLPRPTRALPSAEKRPRALSAARAAGSAETARGLAPAGIAEGSGRADDSYPSCSQRSKRAAGFCGFEGFPRLFWGCSDPCCGRHRGAPRAVLASALAVPCSRPCLLRAVPSSDCSGAEPKAW